MEYIGGSHLHGLVLTSCHLLLPPAATSFYHLLPLPPDTSSYHLILPPHTTLLRHDLLPPPPSTFSHHLLLTPPPTTISYNFLLPPHPTTISYHLILPPPIISSYHLLPPHLTTLLPPPPAANSYRENEQADRLASRGPVIGQLTLDKGDILHSLYTCRLDSDTEVDEISGVRLREFGISRGDTINPKTSMNPSSLTSVDGFNKIL